MNQTPPPPPTSSTPKMKSLSFSAFIRCGFAGEPRPIHVIPSPIGGDGGMDGGCCGKTKEEWVEVLTGLLSRVYTESLQCRPRVREGERERCEKRLFV